jgi:ribosome biogenesis GTPase / thiamine phosphate phosphatase
VLDLETLGWDDAWAAAFQPHTASGLVPGRVAIQHRGEYDVLTADGDVRVGLPGRTRRDATSVSERPVVGDWVALEEREQGRLLVREVLPRRTAFSRRAAHDPASGASREQVVAANVDVVFVTLSIVTELDRRLVERYLTLVLESGARPVLLLTKADLEDDPETVAVELASVGGDVPVVLVSTRSGLGLEAVRAQLGEGITGALVGPSGAGKSTLVNALVGEERLVTGSVAADGAGRHTTTRRELVVLPGGGLLVDNPGMREVHLWLADDGFDEAFADIAALAAECRFADCRHESEPGCAVRAAVDAGRLDAERFRSYLALRRELVELEERLVRRGRSRARRGRPGAGAS